MLEALGWGGILAQSPVWERHKRSSWETRLVKTACGLVGRKIRGQSCLQPSRQGIWIWCEFSIKYNEFFYNYLASISRLFYPLVSSRLLSFSIFWVLFLEKVRARDWYMGGSTAMESQNAWYIYGKLHQQRFTKQCMSFQVISDLLNVLLSSTNVWIHFF